MHSRHFVWSWGGGVQVERYHHRHLCCFAPIGFNQNRNQLKKTNFSSNSDCDNTGVYHICESNCLDRWFIGTLTQTKCFWGGIFGSCVRALFVGKGRGLVLDALAEPFSIGWFVGSWFLKTPPTPVSLACRCKVRYNIRSDPQSTGPPTQLRHLLNVSDMCQIFWKNLPPDFPASMFNYGRCNLPDKWTMFTYFWRKYTERYKEKFKNIIFKSTLWFTCKFIVLALPFLTKSVPVIHFFQMISFPKIFQIAWSAMSRWWGGIKSLVILAITPSQPSFCKYSGNVTKNICSQYKKDFFTI